MNIRIDVPLLLVCVTVLLCSACGSGDAGVCGAGFSGGSINETDVACTGCSEQNLEAAIDGDGDSAAELIFNADGVTPAGGQVDVNTVAGGGRSFGAGGEVGAYLQFPVGAGAGYTDVGVAFITSRNGVPQETISGSTTGQGQIDGAGGEQFYGGASTKPFDAVTMQVSLHGALKSAKVQVFEICGAR